MTLFDLSSEIMTNYEVIKLNTFWETELIFVVAVPLELLERCLNYLMNFQIHVY